MSGRKVDSHREEITLEQIKAWLDAITVTDGKIATE